MLDHHTSVSSLAMSRKSAGFMVTKVARCTAAVVLGTVGTAGDANMLTRALENIDPFVREHAA